MNCINHQTCQGQVDLTDPTTYWEATVAVRDRDEGGPNRRNMQRTGRGYCPDCSIRLEHNMPIGQTTLV